MPQNIADNPRISASGALPDARLKMLIKAATAEADAGRYWADYQEILGARFPNEGEFRLFAQVADNVDEEEAFSHPWLVHATDFATRRWTSNAKLQKTVEDLLVAEDLPLIWTKGTVLAQFYYGSPKLRPSADLDALVLWETLPQFLALAKDLGWTRRISDTPLNTRFRLLANELSFDCNGQGELDLGWQPRMPFAFSPNVMAEVVANATHVEGRRMKIAGPEWLLIETIEHGLQYNQVHAIRWLVDALMILRKHPDGLDWEMILRWTKDAKLGLIVRVGLETLSRFSEKVPQSVLHDLEQLPTSALEHDEFLARLAPMSLEDSHGTQRRYNLLRRAPALTYARYGPSPFSRSPNFTPRARAWTALRNLWTRSTYPVRLLFHAVRPSN